MNATSQMNPELADPYASRVAERWEAAPRQDPVLYSDAEHPLSQAERERYESDGFIALPHLIGAAEAARLLEEAQRMAAEVKAGAQGDANVEGAIIEPGSRAVRSIFRVHRENELFRAICNDPRIVDLARQILGGEVYIHQSRINFKPALDGKEFFWHSDFETWHVEDGMPRMRAVSISLSLTENNEFNGPLMLVPGSHRTYVRCAGATPEEHYKQSLKKQEYGVPSREAMQMLVEQGGIVAPKGGPGSAVAFDCNTLHGSVGNLSPHPRTNLFLVFNSVENALVEPFGGTPPRPDFLGER